MFYLPRFPFNIIIAFFNGGESVQFFNAYIFLSRIVVTFCVIVVLFSS